MRASTPAAPASATPKARIDALDADAERGDRPSPSTVSAERVGEAPPPALGRPAPAVVLGGGDPDRVEDFDEDAPTTLIDTSAPAMRALLAEAGLAPTKGEVAATERIQLPTESEMALTERLQVPPRPKKILPADPSAVPMADGPPPLPASHADLPSSARHAVLDPPQEPDTRTLKPGATIIPPDDWNEDFIEDEEVDETMLLVRPPLPPKE
ncbi:MAG: hypothetical protein CL927_09810 [Deltaproteobacteria bacterium]|nr:hypothetical protein [Deltaproteobacteria bacterium]